MRRVESTHGAAKRRSNDVDQAWWLTLAHILNTAWSRACPRPRCTDQGYYDYITGPQGQAIVLRCPCGACEHIVVSAWSGTPSIPARGYLPKGETQLRVRKLLTAMGIRDDTRAVFINRKVLLPGQPGRHGRSVNIPESDFEDREDTERTT